MTLCDRGEAWVLQIAEAAMGKRFRRSSGISEKKTLRVSFSIIAADPSNPAHKTQDSLYAEHCNFTIKWRRK
jgi:hypothetical protein